MDQIFYVIYYYYIIYYIYYILYNLFRIFFISIFWSNANYPCTWSSKDSHQMGIMPVRTSELPLAGCSQMLVTVRENASRCLAGRVEYDRVMQEYMCHVTVSLFSKAVRGDLLESCLVLYSLASDPEELVRSLNVHTSSRPPSPQNSLSLRRKCLVFSCIKYFICGCWRFALKRLASLFIPSYWRALCTS